MLPYLKKLFGLCAVFSLMGVLSSPAGAQESGRAHKILKVATYNVNEGSDFNEVLGAQTFPDFLAAVQFTLDSVKTSNPPLRMMAIARQIAFNRPDLVGLQEVTTWRVGPGPNPSPVLFDMLQELQDALKAQGQHYKVVVVVPEFVLQAPLPDLTTFVSASDTDVILARVDDDLQLSNVQFANYTTVLAMPTLVGPVTILRGWGSVDAALQGEHVRFIVTHLENFIPQIPATIFFQQAQLNELLAGPANTSLPVIVAGDYNADAANASDPTFATYQEMAAGGFRDAWTATQFFNRGLTWQLIDSSKSPSTMTQRIDFIFFRGDMRALLSYRLGDRWFERVGGHWPSDHAGVEAFLLLD